VVGLQLVRYAGFANLTSFLKGVEFEHYMRVRSPNSAGGMPTFISFGFGPDTYISRVIYDNYATFMDVHDSILGSLAFVWMAGLYLRRFQLSLKDAFDTIQKVLTDMESGTGATICTFGASVYRWLLMNPATLKSANQHSSMPLVLAFLLV